MSGTPGPGPARNRPRAERSRAPPTALGPTPRRAGVPEPRARASTESELESSPSGSGDASPDEREPAVGSEPRREPTVSVGAAAQAGYASIPANAFKGLLQGELRLGEGMSSWATTLSFAYARGTSEIEDREARHHAGHRRARSLSPGVHRRHPRLAQSVCRCAWRRCALRRHCE